MDATDLSTQSAQEAAEHLWDVIVIGGGPAGLSAAVRARWVKGHDALGAKTLLIAGGTLGGLVAWRGSYLTGPGWYEDADSQLGHLYSDIERLEIPVLRDYAEQIEQTNDGFVTVRVGGHSVLAHSVIVATGLRRQANESDGFGQNVYLTYMSSGKFAQQIDSIVRQYGNRARVLLVGRTQSSAIAPILNYGLEQGLRMQRLVPVQDLHSSSNQPEFIDIPTVAGTWLGVNYGAKSARFRLADGEVCDQPVDAIFFDYNAFELRPDCGVHCPVQTDTMGYWLVDAEGRTNISGVYAAGDIIPGPKMVLGALYSGARAAFAAYFDRHRAQFGEAPDMFAYWPSARVFEVHSRVFPQWLPDDQLVSLVKPESLQRLARVSAECAQALQQPQEIATMVALFDIKGSDIDDWVAHKWLTVRRMTQ